MNVKRINESFKKLYENVLEEDQGEVFEVRLELEKAADELYRRQESNIKAYEVAFQDVLEKMFPDKAWWEVCKLDIFNHLFTERDPEATIEAIVDSLTYKVENYHEENDAVKNDEPAEIITENIDNDDRKLEISRRKIIESLKQIVSRLNESEMSDEDKHDSELIYSMIQKIQNRSNAAFTPEEKAVMAKYGITRNNWQKKLTVADRELNPDLDSNSREYYYRKGGFSNGTPSKINYADRARKLPIRKDSQIAGDGSSSFYQNAHFNSHGRGASFQTREREIAADQMRAPLDAMRWNLKDRRIAQSYIDNADSERERRMAAAQLAYDRAKADADRSYHYDTVDSARRRDNAQKEIDKLLKRNTNESIEGTSKVFKINYDSNGVNSAVMVKANNEDEAKKIYNDIKGQKYPKINAVSEINSNDAETNKKKGMSTLN